jgi:hypothetical protein
MKYLKYYKLFESFKELTLYHGGLEGGYDEETGKNIFNRFTQFSKKTAYFSNNPQFAIDYADTKSMDRGLDADKYLYTCKFKGNLFEYTNKEDMDKLINLLPDKVKVNHGTMWFLDHDFTKEEMIKKLQGIDIIKPEEEIANANIGDIVPDPSYKTDKMIVVDKNDDFVYTVMMSTYNDYLWSSAKGYNEHWTEYTKFKDIFLEWRQSIVDWYNKMTGSNRSLPKYSSFNDFFQTYQFAKKGYSIDYVSYRNNDDKLKLTDEDKENIENIWNKCVQNYYAIAKKELSRSKWTRKILEVPNTDFWNYYENDTIINLIKKLGYDGYMALERNHKTYAIYEPYKTIEIIKSERIR